MLRVLEGNLFPPRLTQGLERSLSAFILIVSLTLLALSFSLMILRPCTSGVLKGVDLCLSCSLLPHVLAGVLKGVSVHVSLVTLMPSTPRVLKGVNLYCSLLPHALTGVFKRSLFACPHSHGLERTGWMVLKGPRCNSLVPL